MLQFVRTIAVTAAILGGACAAQAQTQPPAETVTIEDAAWLAGRWVGEGFGGQMEEAWAPPVGGQMIGHFRYWRDGQPQFYEFMIMDVVEGGIRMRLKHFNPDYTTWEDRETWTTFEPVSVDSDRIVFNGLTIVREAPDQIVMTIRIRRGETVSEDVLRFQRAPL
ncbi:MAG: hypothetical protein K2X34_01165 [Hyphomonadaceae bacterium]|nr:hypothetical protein [Hyphomonadaceae bacterium]